MLVQRMVTPVSGAVSWTVPDDDGDPVEPVEEYPAYLACLEPRDIGILGAGRYAPARRMQLSVSGFVRPPARLVFGRGQLTAGGDLHVDADFMPTVAASRLTRRTVDPPHANSCQRLRWLEPITIWVIWCSVAIAYHEAAGPG